MICVKFRWLTYLPVVLFSLSSFLKMSKWQSCEALKKTLKQHRLWTRWKVGKLGSENMFWSTRPVLIIVFIHVVRPFVPTFENLANQNNFQVKTMFTTGETVGLAEWIIDDTCHFFYFGCWFPLIVTKSQFSFRKKIIRGFSPDFYEKAAIFACLSYSQWALIFLNMEHF